ncbi:MAG: trigger factor [Acidobacteriota bacterium]
MKSEIKEISPTQKEIHVQIDAESVKEAYGKVSKKYASRANVPGFRKGYAPLDVVRLRFKEEIKSEVLQDVIPGKVAEAIQEHKLHPLSEPHLHLENQDTVKVNGSEPLTLHVHVEVMPEIPKPKYTGIEVTRRLRPVEDTEVEDVIAQRLQKEAALIPVEGRKSKLGDTVIADLEGTFADDPDGQPISANDLEIVLGDEVIEKSFTDNLVGVTEDDEKEFTVAYPADFSSEALAGKTLNYKAKIKSVGLMEKPELNDEWAKSLDEGYKSLADLRKRLRADLDKYAQADADARVRNEAVEKLIQDNAFEVPNALIENQARNLLNNFAQDMQKRGVDLNKVEPQFIEMAYGNMRQQAERDVRGSMLLEKVGELEKVEVADAEVDAEVAKMAEVYKATVEEVRESLESQGGGLENIRHNLKTRKAIEALIKKVKVTDGEWIDESAAQPEATEKPKKAEKKKEPAKKAAKKNTA